MSKSAKQSAKTEQVKHQFDADYERIMRLARLVNPTIPAYRETVKESQEIETITTYGVQVRIP
jgi:hypothetical protein